MKLILFLLSLCSSQVFASWAVGNQSAVESKSQKFQKSIWYVEPSFKEETDIQGYSLVGQAQFRLAMDLQSDFRKTAPGSLSPEVSEILVREAKLSLAKGSSRTVVGLQQISWGETFGIQILDIVNGRDLRDPLMLETGWTRLAAPILQQQFFQDKTTYQFILTAMPSHNRLPRSGSAFDTTNTLGVELQENARTVGDEYPAMPEFGGKISQLFRNGLDVSILLFSHYNRNTVYQLRTSLSPSGPMRLQPIVGRVLSAGGSASYALNEFVLRGDYIAHNGQPLAMGTNTVVSDGTQHRLVVCFDWTRNNWTLGAQYQLDNNDSYKDAPWNHAQWGSAQISRTFLNRALELSIFAYGGISNRDMWLQPKIQYSFGATIISLRHDMISATNHATSALYNLRESGRTLLWVEHRF